MTKRIAVTGATGFVGPHLVAALARHGWRARLLVRKWSPLPSLAGVDAEIVYGDLTDRAALDGLLAGVDAVIHAAGLIKARRSRDFMTVNRDGTALLSSLAPDIPLLLLSSFAAREPKLSAYAASKRAAEQALEARKGPWLAVRAPAVYGPGDRETLTYFKAVSRGIAPEPAVPGARLALIHVEDLVEALATALDRSPQGGVYEIDDGGEGGYGYEDMAEAASRALGRSARRVRIPRWAMASVAAVNEGLQALGGPVQILTAGKVAEIFHPDWGPHDRRLAAALDFRPRFDLRRGFEDTISWYQARKWL